MSADFDREMIDEYLFEEEESRPVRKLPEPGRNDPCPCGSGKKYKKCCARVTPEKPLEYYLEKMEKLEEQKEEEELYRLILAAEKDYPINPIFCLIHASICLKEGRIEEREEEVLESFLKAWRIMGTDLEQKYLLLLVNLLMRKRDYDQAEEIFEAALEEKEASSDLLLLGGHLFLTQGDEERGFSLLEKAREQDPDNHFALQALLEAKVNHGYFYEAFQYFLENFEQLIKTADRFQQEDSQEGPIDYLKLLLQETLHPDEGADNQQLKEDIQEFLKLSDKLEQCSQIIDDRSSAEPLPEEFFTLTAELREEIPPKGRLALSLLDIYNLAGDAAVDALLSYGQEVEEYQQGEYEFNRLLAGGYLSQGMLAEARDYYTRAFKLAVKDYQSQQAEKEKQEEEGKRAAAGGRGGEGTAGDTGSGGFKAWDLVGDYLAALTTAEDREEVTRLLEEVRPFVPEDESLLSMLMLSLEDKSYRETWQVLMKIEDLDTEKLVDRKEYYTTLIHMVMLGLEDTEDFSAGELTGKLYQRLQGLVKKCQEIDYQGFAGTYSGLILEYAPKEREKAEFREKLEEALQIPVEYGLESDLKYKAVVKYGNPEKVTRGEIDEGLLEEDLQAFYQWLAYLRLKEYRAASLQFLKLIDQGIPKLFYRGFKLIGIEDLEGFMKNFGMPEKEIGQMKSLLGSYDQYINQIEV